VFDQGEFGGFTIESFGPPAPRDGEIEMAVVAATGKPTANRRATEENLMVPERGLEPPRPCDH
jgi:hypothetical protein